MYEDIKVQCKNSILSNPIKTVNDTGVAQTSQEILNNICINDCNDNGECIKGLYNYFIKHYSTL